MTLSSENPRRWHRSSPSSERPARPADKNVEGGTPQISAEALDAPDDAASLEIERCPVALRLEAASIVWSIKRLRGYLWGTTFTERWLVIFLTWLPTTSDARTAWCANNTRSILPESNAEILRCPTGSNNSSPTPSVAGCGFTTLPLPPKVGTDAKVLNAKISLNWTGPFKILAVGPSPAEATPDGRPLAAKLYLDLPNDMPGADASCRVNTVSQ